MPGRTASVFFLKIRGERAVFLAAGRPHQRHQLEISLTPLELVCNLKLYFPYFIRFFKKMHGLSRALRRVYHD